MKIYWATRLRGFLWQLSKGISDITFIESKGYYETTTLLHKIKSSLIRSRFLNPMGFFQVIEAKGKDCDFYGAFNRFLNTDKPYFIYLENPTALYHYTPNRNKWFLGRQRFKKCINDPNLRYIVCMSEACRDTFETLNGKIPPHLTVQNIYPLVPKNPHATPESIKEKSEGEYLECLFCVQGQRFVSKGGMEVLRAVTNLQKKGLKIHLTVITKISDLDKSALEALRQANTITLHDFTFSYAEIEEVYAKSNVLLQPASDESFGMTVLEAMKGGCTLITSKLYAFPEMVIEGYNGFLAEPKYWFFDQNRLPNMDIWYRRKETIYSLTESPELIAFLEEKLITLYEDRALLHKYSLNSLTLAQEKFNEDMLRERWNDVWNALKQ